MLSLLSSGSRTCEFPRIYTYLYIYIYMYMLHTHTYRERERERHICNSTPDAPFFLITILWAGSGYGWWFRNPAITRLRGEYPIIYKGFLHPNGGVGCLPSTVSKDVHGFFCSPPSQALTNCYIGGSQGQKLQKVPWLNRQPRHLIPMEKMFAMISTNWKKMLLRSYESLWWNELYIYLGIKWLMVSKNPCLVLYGVFDSLLASTDLWSQMKQLKFM